MTVNRLKQIFHPEELIVAPFLIAMVILYWLFGMSINFRPAFVYWITLVVIFFFALWFFAFFVKVSIDLHKGGSWPRMNWIAPLSMIRAWAPLFLIVVVYENLHNLVPYLMRHDKDQLLARIDSYLFGSTPVTVYLQKFVTPWLTDWLSLCYLSFFLYLPLLGIVLYTRSDRRGWRVFVLAVTLTVFLGFIGYVLIPAVGPLYYLSNSYSVDLNGNVITSIRQTFISDLSIGRDAFPSLHIALTALYLLLAYKYKRYVFFIFLPFIICLWFSTVYLRYHYMVDVVAGFVLAFLAFFAAEKIYTWWYNEN